MNPLIIKLGGAALSLALAFGAGWKVNQWRHDASQLAAQTAAEAAFRVALAEVNNVSAKLQATTDDLETKRMKTVKEIYHETIKPVYSECILPASGVQLYNAAAAESAATGKP